MAAMSLPVDLVLPDLLATLTQRSALVLQAPPGSGKTTRVPLALLGWQSDASGHMTRLEEPAWLAGRRVVMLEPRRLAARSAARYMASLIGEPVGQRIGYRTRLDTRISAGTRIEVVTEGILTRLLRDDPELSDYAAVIFDEFHERSLQADLGLALTRECQDVLRDDLRLIVMSATLDPLPLSRLLGDAPVLSCEGRLHPVTISYSPPDRLPLPDHLRQEILRLLHQETGSLLVFLPGEGEIRRLAERLQDALPPDVDLCPLFGQLAGEDQDRAIAPAAAGRRKVVLATSIAETSLTIEGIRVVVDAGLMRVPCFDPGSGMTRLVTHRVSQANAEQRRGRAGRLGPGHCLRLWSGEEQQRLRPFATPEILAADLADLVLALAAWGTRDPAGMAWLDPPPAPAWAQARDQLTALGALTADGSITAHGEAMQRLGLPPRLAHLLLCGRAEGLSRLAADLAALLAERDLLGSRDGADIHHRLAVLRGERASTGVDRGRLRLVRDSARRLMDSTPHTAAGKPPRDSTLTKRVDRADSPADVGRLLARAWPDAVARRRPGNAPRYLLASGRGATLPADDALAGEPWLVVVETDGQAREARIFQAASVDAADIESLFADRISTQDDLAWDAQAGAVSARRLRRLGAIVIDEQPLPRPAAEVLLPAFVAGVQASGSDVLPWTPALRQWQARVNILHDLVPSDWPDVSDAQLLVTLADWAGPWLTGMRRLADLASLPLQDALGSLLSWPQQQELERQLPRSLDVPSGSTVDIDYTAEHGQVLAVKLQEVFGWQDTPRLADGRIALTMHLLSPARRPIAVTGDLASFWRNAYGEVRKDLRGRYPKHPWPEDPLTAVAQRGVKHPKPKG